MNFATALLIALNAVAPAQPTAPDPAPGVGAAAPRLLVLDFRNDGVDPGVPRSLRDALVAHLGADTRVEVISAEEMRTALALEGQREMMGCEDAATSCIAELAAALNAEFVLSGSVGRLGALHMVALTLAAGKTSRTVGRAAVEGNDLGALPAQLRAEGTRLLDVALGKSAAPPAAAPVSAATGESSMLPTVLLVTGGALAVAGVATGLVAGIVAQDAFNQVPQKTTFVDKQERHATGVIASWVALGGAGVAVLGGCVVGASLLVE
jgi:hypothetical protein